MSEDDFENTNSDKVTYESANNEIYEDGSLNSSISKTSDSQKDGKSGSFIEKLDSKALAVVFAIIVIIGVGVVAGIIINSNQGKTETEQSEEVDEDDYILSEEEEGEAFDEMYDYIKKTESEQIAEAKAEADATNDNNKKAEAFSRRINEMLEMGDPDIAQVILEAGDEYFNESNNPEAALALYIAIDYDELVFDTSAYYYYQTIMDLANEVGDEQVKSEWQARYDKAKAEFDEYNSASGEEDNEMEEE